MDQKTASDLASGAPGTISLGGKTWLVDQPGPVHFSTLRTWVRARLKSPLQAVAEEVKGLPPELQTVAVKAAVELQASGSEVTADRVDAELATVDGCCFWLWLLSRAHHEGITPETFRSFLDPPELVHGVLADLRTATQMRAVSPNSNGASGEPASHPPTISK